MVVGKEEESRADAANEKLWAEFQRRRRAARLQEFARFTPTKSALEEAVHCRTSGSPSAQLPQSSGSKKQALISSPSARTPGALTRGAAAVSPTSSSKQQAGESEIQQLLAAVQLERSRPQACTIGHAPTAREYLKAVSPNARSADAATLRRSASYPSYNGRTASPPRCLEKEVSVLGEDKQPASRSEERRNGREMEPATPPQRRPVSASARISSTSNSVSTRGGSSTSAMVAETRGKESVAGELGKPRDTRSPLSSGVRKTPQKTSSSTPALDRTASPGRNRSMLESESAFVDEDAVRCAEKRRTLELPAAFGTASQQQFAAQLRTPTSPSLNTSFASRYKGSMEQPVAWNGRTVCPRNFNGFWGPDVKYKVPVRAMSRPRMLGPGQHPVPSKELVRWHLMKATNLLKCERQT